jgi:beta-N-acetylhexosaminidase
LHICAPALQCRGYYRAPTCVGARCVSPVCFKSAQHRPLTAGLHTIPSAAQRVATLGALLGLLLLAACSATPLSPAALARPTPSVASAPSPRGAVTSDPNAQNAALRQTANWYLSQLTLDQKLGQMMLIETLYTSYSHDVDNMVHGMHAGATIVYKQNMVLDSPAGPADLKHYLATIQAHADLPMMVSMDEEGGVVDRLGLYHFAPPLPAPQDTANTGDPQQAYQAGVRAARQMLPFGINTNLAPVADVRLTPGAIEWTRMYGNDPNTVVKFAGAFLQGVQDTGVIGTVKHWPGAGSLTVDPHKALPVMTRTHDQLEATEFASFRGMLKLDPGIVMVTHVLVQAIDSTLPATLSPKLVQGVLRDELGYDGVVMTDSLYMQGIAVRYNLGQAAVLAVEAGDDLLEGAYDTGSMRSMIDSIKQAMAQGQISQERIDQSVRRILLLKLRFGLLPTYHPSPVHGGDSAAVGAASDLITWPPSLAGKGELAPEADVRHTSWTTLGA